MKFTFDLALREATTDIERTAWHPVLPEGVLKAYDGKAVNVSRDYLEQAVAETRRFYQDQMKRTGHVVHRPILIKPHEDADEALHEGRTSGKIVDFEVRDYKGKPTLFLKGRWTKSGWDAMEDGSLEYGSVNIKSEYIDPQTGEKYGPFINEFSETASPVIKDFHLAELIQPDALAAVGLTLAETGGDMDVTELVQSVTEITAALGVIGTKVDALAARIDALEGGGEEAEEGAEAPADEVAASEDKMLLLLSEIREENAKLRGDLEKVVRVGALNTSESGNPGSPGNVELSETERKSKVLKTVKAEGFKGLAAVRETKRRMEVR